MSDGHTGVDNKKLNQGGSGGFVLVLAALTQSTGETDWVIHAKSQSWQRHNRFLTDSGLAYYSGHCLFHDDSCHYGVIGRVVRDGDGDTGVSRVREMHDAFETFAGNVGHLFDFWQQQAEILRQIGIDPPAKPFFGPPARIVANAGGVPAWVEDEKFPQLRDWEKKRADIDSQVQELSVFLPLLYETGDRLRDAVISGLRLLGLDAEPTEPGFTVDITARTRDGSRRFGIEVTGIEEGIKKSSNKLTQVMAFEQKKDDDEKNDSAREHLQGYCHRRAEGSGAFHASGPELSQAVPCSRDDDLRPVPYGGRHPGRSPRQGRTGRGAVRH